MTSREKSDIAQHVTAILEKCGIKSAPIAVDKVAKALGAQVRYSPLDEELSGMIYIHDGTPIIGVNARHSPNRQRFTIAHEIGHLQLHRDLIAGKVHVDKQFPIEFAGLNRDTKSASGTESVEIEANQFAAQLLMPTEFLTKALASKPFDIDDESPLNELAKKFRVSRQALEFRIRNLQ
jgi:Zn-dependent peptidase ImmA (M78 family)